ncbi:MAG: hypothetical protein U9N09_10445 [Euryarchaeota archaeon]|nr:hypothetical protein [Euryarchaeota archaeon]
MDRQERSIDATASRAGHYRFGFAQASGDCIVMGDADNTYDFMDIPRLLEPLKRRIRHRLTLIDTDLKNNKHPDRGAEA